MNGEDLSTRFVAKVIGKVVSALPGEQFGRLHYRNLKWDKIYALSANQGMFRQMHSLEGTILIMNECSIMTCSPGFVRFSQVLPLTCLGQF